MGPASSGPPTWKDLRSRVTIAQVLEGVGAISRFRREGPRLVGPCPVHGGDNPRAFSVDTQRERWFCFTRCLGGGDVITLAFRLCGASWPRTAAWLEKLAGSVPTDGVRTIAAASDHTRSPGMFRPFTRALPLDARHPFFGRMGLRPLTVEHFEAGAWHGQGFLQGMVAVRLHDADGRPLGYAGRRLDPDEVRRLGKWKFPPRYPKAGSLFGWHRTRSARVAGLIVVESPWSTMKLWQAGLPNAVALCGVRVSDLQREALAQAARILLILDGDDAGEEATHRLVRRQIHPRLAVARPPWGTDPADLEEVTLRALVERSWTSEAPAPVPAGP